MTFQRTFSECVTKSNQNTLEPCNAMKNWYHRQNGLLGVFTKTGNINNRRAFKETCEYNNFK